MSKKSYLKLRRLAEDQDIELQELAKQANIGERTLYTRLEATTTGKSWRAFEIAAICKVLHIPQEQIGEYFFPTVEKGESA